MEIDHKTLAVTGFVFNGILMLIMFLILILDNEYRDFKEPFNYVSLVANAIYFLYIVVILINQPSEVSRAKLTGLSIITFIMIIVNILIAFIFRFEL